MAIWGHRGVYGIENTIDSLNNIKKYNNDKIQFGVEFDIQMTKYGEIICFHDSTLNRLFSENTKVYNINSAKIKELNIPYFKDILDHFKGTNYTLDAEIKTYNLSPDQIVQMCSKVVNIIVNKKLEENCIITSFNMDAVEYILENYSNISCSLIANKFLPLGKLVELQNKGMDYIVLDKKLYKNLDIVESLGFRIALYTLFKDNCEEDQIILEAVLGKKNISIITDDVDKCINFLIANF